MTELYDQLAAIHRSELPPVHPPPISEDTYRYWISYRCGGYFGDEEHTQEGKDCKTYDEACAAVVKYFGRWESVRKIHALYIIKESKTVVSEDFYRLARNVDA